MPSTRLLGALLILAAATATAAGQVPTDARDWIQRMNKAVVEGNFEGVFRDRSGAREEEWRIVHRFKDGQMAERLVATDGSGYEQKRTGSQWRAFKPKQRRVELATRNRSFGYIQAINGLDEIAARHYDISDAGPARLLGRQVQMIRVEPRDDLRYGYRFWLDVASALPLKLQRVTRDGTVVRELSFTFINAPLLPTDIADEQLKVAVNPKGFMLVDWDRFTPFFNPWLKRAYSARPELMPPGYRIRVFGGPPEGKVDGQRARFIVSDGVSWADVFIAPVSPESRPGARPTDGGGKMNALSFYQITRDGVHVTVTGEMPVAAAEAIAKAFRPE